MTVVLFIETLIGISGSTFLNYSNPILQVFTLTFEKRVRLDC